MFSQELGARYRELLEQVGLLKNPPAFILAVIFRKVNGWRIEFGIPVAELFHEGVVALWNAWEEWKLLPPVSGNASKAFSTYGWEAIRWHLIGYIKANYGRFSAEMPLADCYLDGEGDFEEALFTDEAEVERLYSVEALVDKVMAAFKRGAKSGTPKGGRTRLNLATEERYRRIITMAAAGYNGDAIARELGYTARAVVNTVLRTLRQELLKDQEFMAEFGPAVVGRRMDRLGKQTYSRTHSASAGKVGGAAKWQRLVDPELAHMSPEKIMMKYGVCLHTARLARRRGWIATSPLKAVKREPRPVSGEMVQVAA